MLLTGAEIIAEVLIEQGVDTVFGYPGGSVLNIYDALYQYSDRINHYMSAHEQGAAHAADGYARLTGKTGVVISTSGPGATNLVTGIATAYMDSVPLVAITGNVPTSLIGRDSFQEVYIAGITMPITKHNFTVRSVSELADILRSAFKIAAEGRPGPVLIDIPKDVTINKADFEVMLPVDTTPEEKPLKHLEKVADLINSSKFPVVYFGGGVRLSGAEQELFELLKKAEIPATYTMMAAGVLSYGDELNMGLIGMHGSRTANLAVDNADLVLAIGTRFSDRVALNTNKFARRARIVHIDIDPSEVGKNVPADTSIIGDVKRVLTALLPMVEKASHTEWLAQINQWREKDYHPKDDDSVLKPHQVMSAICDAAGEDAVYITDVGQHQMWAAQYIRHLKTKSFLTSGGLGTMGYGYGAALGAAVADDGKRPIIHITGDGSFHMNMNEACTAVSYNLPVITVIMNNSVLGMVRQWQKTFYGKRYSSSEPERKTNYKAVAEGFGLTGFKCTNLAEFKEALDKALELKAPVWIECVIDREEAVLPMIPAGGSVDDMIIN